MGTARASARAGKSLAHARWTVAVGVSRVRPTTRPAPPGEIWANPDFADCAEDEAADDDEGEPDDDDTREALDGTADRECPPLDSGTEATPSSTANNQNTM